MYPFSPPERWDVPYFSLVLLLPNSDGTSSPNLQHSILSHSRDETHEKTDSTAVVDATPTEFSAKSASFPLTLVWLIQILGDVHHWNSSCSRQVFLFGDVFFQQRSDPVGVIRPFKPFPVQFLGVNSIDPQTLGKLYQRKPILSP